MPRRIGGAFVDLQENRIKGVALDRHRQRESRTCGPDTVEDIERHVREIGRLQGQLDLEGDGLDVFEGMILREQPLSGDELRRIKLADGQVERDNVAFNAIDTSLTFILRTVERTRNGCQS